MRTIRYKIIHDIKQELFEEQVTKALQAGWKIAGDLIILNSKYYLQMINDGS